MDQRSQTPTATNRGNDTLLRGINRTRTPTVAYCGARNLQNTGAPGIIEGVKLAIWSTHTKYHEKLGYAKHGVCGKKQIHKYPRAEICRLERCSHMRITPWSDH